MRAPRFIRQSAVLKGKPAAQSTAKRRPMSPATTMPTIVKAFDMGDPTCNRGANVENSGELFMICRNPQV
jgi:hypothetical protein